MSEPVSPDRIAKIRAAVEDIDDPPDGMWGMLTIRALLAERETLREALREAETFAFGTVEHVYEGSCPDVVEGPEPRDPGCPVCQWLDRVDPLLAEGAPE